MSQRFEKMRNVLHIITDSEEPLAREIILSQRQLADHQITVVDLTVNDPDYRALLEEIFRADSIETW